MNYFNFTVIILWRNTDQVLSPMDLTVKKKTANCCSGIFNVIFLQATDPTTTSVATKTASSSTIYSSTNIISFI
jgi:hypothetical protein